MNKVTALVEYSVSEVVLSDLEEKAKNLKIKDVNDRDGYALVDKTRKEAKRLKIDIEKERVAQKTDALAYGRMVDEEAQKYSKRLIAIEDILSEEQKRIDEIKEQIKKEKEQLEKLPGRKLLLAEFEETPADDVILAMEEATFTYLVQSLIADRQAKIQQEQEKERLALEKERQAIKEAKQQEQAKIQQEREKLAKEQKDLADKLQKIEEDKIRDEENTKAKEKAVANALKQEKENQRLLEVEQRRKKDEEEEKWEKDKKFNQWKEKNNFDSSTDRIVTENGQICLMRIIAKYL